MPTRHVVLGERYDALIEALVDSGRYQDASEVVRDGLRLIEQREVEEAAKLDALREAAALGLNAIEQGDVTRFETIEALKAHLDRIGTKAIEAASKE